MAVFFIIIISIIILSLLLILCSTLKINIKELEIENTKIIKFNIKITMNLLGKLTWLKITINERKIDKLRKNDKVKAINEILQTKILKKYENIRAIAIKDWKSIIRNLKKVEIEHGNFKIAIGTENAATTAYITGIISAIIGIMFSRTTSKIQYLIKPVYIDKTYLFLSINCIIALKLVHIINIIKELKGKEVYQTHGRTSNRRAYGNSNG